MRRDRPQPVDGKPHIGDAAGRKIGQVPVTVTLPNHMVQRYHKAGLRPMIITLRVSLAFSETSSSSPFAVAS